MKLNPDCIRDILLYLEENLKISENEFSSITFQKIKCDLSNYSEDDIFYSIYNLKQIRYIEGNIKDVGEMKMYICEIQNITWNGHQFLNTIRPTSVWEATKLGASKLGIMSIQALSTIAMKVAEAIVTNPIVINKIIERL